MTIFPLQTRRWHAGFVVGMALTLVMPCASRAQAIRGLLVDRGNLPVAGAVVLLTDSAAHVVMRALSNDRGEFRVTASRAGHYRLRTLRVGFRPFTSDAVDLHAGEVVTQRFVLASVQVALDTVRVVSKNVCRVDRDSAASTFAVWEQVRTALDATRLTGSERNVYATVVTYDRHLDRMGHAIIGQTTAVANSVAAQPWRSLSPDSLHRAGYVENNGAQSTVYHAPDLEVLLSDVFLQDHCFHLTTGRDKTRLGIVFSPSSAREKTPEVSGTLWLDRASAELRSFEFHYENILAEQEVESGGAMEFAHLRDGTWVIAHWNIRMPVLERVVRTPTMGGDHLVITQIQVTGGDLALATRGADTLWARDPLVLRGDVVDSTSGRGVRDAVATLSGTSLEGRTDRDGHFTIPGVLPGTYTLDVRTPSLDSVNAAHQSVLDFVDGKERARVRVPSARSVLAAMCMGGGPEDAGIVTGSVTVTGGGSLPSGLRVVAEWVENAPPPSNAAGNVAGNVAANAAANGPGTTGATRFQVTPVSARGTYRLCNVPMNTTVVLQTELEGASRGNVKPFSVLLSPVSRIVQANLVLDSALVRGAVLAGVVYGDSAKQPVSDVEIVFPDIGLRTMSNRRGEFRLRDIPPGTHRVVIRRIGYGPVDTRLTFAANETVDRAVYLSRVTVIDSVVVTADRPEPWRRDFEDNRKMGFGQFLTREQLEKKEMQTFKSVLAELRSTRVVNGSGNHAWMTGVRSSRDQFRPTELIDVMHGAVVACYSDVYLDNLKIFGGRPHEALFDLNDLSPAQIEAIEFYADGMQVPSNYDSRRSCGLLVIHTRRVK